MIKGSELNAQLYTLSMGVGGALDADLKGCCRDFVTSGHRRPTLFEETLRRIFLVHEARVKVHHLAKHEKPAPKITVKPEDFAVRRQTDRRGSDVFLDFFRKDLPSIGAKISQAVKQTSEMVEHTVSQAHAKVAEHIPDEERDARLRADAVRRKAGRDKDLFILYDLECSLGLTTPEQSLQKKLRLKRDFAPIADREGLSDDERLMNEARLEEQEGQLELERQAFLMQLIEFADQSDALCFLTSDHGRHCIDSMAALPAEFVARCRQKILSVFTVMKRRSPDMNIAPFRAVFSDEYIRDCLVSNPNFLAEAGMFIIFRSMFNGLEAEGRIRLLIGQDLFSPPRQMLINRMIAEATVNAVFFVGLRKANRNERLVMTRFFKHHGAAILPMLAAVYELLDDLEAPEKEVLPCINTDRAERKKQARIALRQLLLNALISVDDADLLGCLAMVHTNVQAWSQLPTWSDVIAGTAFHRMRDIMDKAGRVFEPATRVSEIHGGNIFRQAAVPAVETKVTDEESTRTSVETKIS